MPQLRKFRCRNCGERFQVEVLNPAEQRRSQNEGRPASAVACPKCGRTDIRPGGNRYSRDCELGAWVLSPSSKQTEFSGTAALGLGAAPGTSSRFVRRIVPRSVPRGQGA